MQGTSQKKVRISKKTKRYLQNLKHYPESKAFYIASEKMLFLHQNNKSDSDITETTICATAPMLISYVLWILKKCERKKIKKIYFLSRDGHIFYKIAILLCRKYHLKIECKYLYVSRCSLCLPLFDIDRNMGMEMLCVGSSNTSPISLVDRIGLSETEKEAIFQSIAIDKNKKKDPLTSIGIKALGDKLSSSSIFCEIVQKKANCAYKQIISYFQQEGLFQSEQFALVDSGWRGGTQKSISAILHSAGSSNIVEGFYFGLEKIREKIYGNYYAFYFKPHRHICRLLNFNYNVFESLCSAEHGMTIAYKKLNDLRIAPILKTPRNHFPVQKQFNLMEEYISLIKIDYESIDEEKLPSCIAKNVKSFFHNPDQNEKKAYGNITFCEDMAENYMIPLATSLPKKLLDRYFFPTRFYHRVIDKKEKREFDESLWIEATLLEYPFHYRMWIAGNDKLFNILRVFHIFLTN